MNQEKLLNFLYHNAFGRIILKPLTLPFVSKLSGLYMNSGLSKHRIKKFIKQNRIDMGDYEEKEYTSFNEFFTRKLKPGARPISDSEFVSPADSRLSAYKLNENSVFFIKGAPYSAETLIGGDPIYKDFANGSCLVFRLCVDDYHRYGFFADGRVLEPPKHIKGVFHTVNPLSLGKYNFFHQNSREYTLLETQSFGKAVYCEIGAMLVGKIKNLPVTEFSKGDEKGFFKFGGSTVVVLTDKDHPINQIYYENTEKNIETKVKYGQNLL